MGADIRWVKLTTDMFDNRKIKYLRKLPDGNNIVLIWVMLLTMAGRCNSGGMIFLTENIPYTTKMLADELDFEENTVTLALKALEQLDMVVTDDGFFRISGWDEHQNIDGMEKVREQNRLRKAKYDAKKKAITSGSVTSNVTVTCGNATEGEEEIEEEYSSSSPTRARGDFEKENEETKLKYMGGTLGEGLLLISEEQFGDLCDKLNPDELGHYCAVVVDCERRGKHFAKSHYQAILDMAAKDRKKGR